ncbi:MAG: DegT/DnrJ/EryC1/StrS family aminotransferase [Elusimicrobia bacterium]|nr:DegT/DnrJ/EryC1/StrS family aminotransferase [Elusimicrobiota bacterium]
MSEVLSTFVMQGGGQGISEFEAALADYFSAPRALTFGSLMRTNYALLTALKQRDQRRLVVLPRYCCPSFIHAVGAAGLQLKFCDVVPETLSYDLNKLEQMNFKDVLVLISPNLFGLSNPIDRLLDLCRKNGVFLAEGVDYGIGSEYRGRRIGTFADVAILNFQEGKALPIGGGALIDHQGKVAEYFNQNRSRQKPNVCTMVGYSVFSRPAFYSFVIFVTKILGVNRKNLSMEDTIRNTNTESDFDFDPNGYERSLSHFQGALGLLILSRLSRDMAIRRQNAELLEKALAGIKGVRLIRREVGLDHVHYIRYPIRVDRHVRPRLLARLLAEGIEASPMYVEHGMNIDASIFPGAESVSAELLTLPCHPFVRPGDVDRIQKVISELINPVARSPQVVSLCI